MRRVLIFAASVILLAGQAAMANTITFVTPPGAVDWAGDSVSAQATLTTSGNTLSIALTNLQQNEKNVGQALTGFSVALSGSIGSLGLTSSSGESIKVGTDGAVTDMGPVNPGWLTSLSGNELTVSFFGGANQPEYAILGPPGPDGSYDGLGKGGSMANNSGHNPFIEETLNFDFSSDSGVTTGITFSNGVFSFGTQSGDNVSVPEPSTLVLLGFILLGWGLFYRRRKSLRTKT